MQSLSEFRELHAVDDSRLWVSHHFLARTSPDCTHCFEQPFGLALGVELQVDHHVIRVFHRAQDLIAAHAVSLSVSRIAVECSLPTAIVRNGVFDSQNWHGRPPQFRIGYQRHCTCIPPHSTPPPGRRGSGLTVTFPHISPTKRIRWFMGPVLHTCWLCADGLSSPG